MAKDKKREDRGRLRRPGHHRARGPRGGAQAARHVHRLDRRARPAPPRLRGRRQLRRRGARRPLPRVDVTIHPDNSVTVVDDGRGIPVAMHEKEKRPAVEVVLTVLHAGGKFGDGGGYKVSGGLHGVGVSVVNALSGDARGRGPPRRPRLDAGVRARRPALRPRQGRGDQASTGTTITFLPDAESSRRLDFDFDTLEQRLRETAFLTRGLRITLRRRARRGPRAEFQYEGGIEDFVRYLNDNKEPLGKKSSSSRARATRAPSRSRCSGTPPTRSPSSPSPTTSTRTRAARTCRASARR